MSRVQTIAAYKAADLFLFTSNIECSPIVLFESMAAKTPFLSTDVGNASEIAQWSNSGEILPTLVDSGCMVHVEIKKAVQALEEIIQNKDKRHQMASDGYLAWKNRFTWEGITKQYEMLYLDLLRQ